MEQAKLKPEVKAAWVAALRSGRFSQTRFCLEDSQGNCCLGVLCRVVNELAPGTIEVRSPRSPIKSTLFDGKSGLPPPVVDEFVFERGLGKQMGVISGITVRIGNNWGPLASHNDNGRTFEEIATAIEEQL